MTKLLRALLMLPVLLALSACAGGAEQAPLALPGDQPVLLYFYTDN